MQQKNQFISLEVDRSHGDDEDFFRLISPEGNEVRLNKLKFQREQPLPERLTCKIKTGFNGQIYYTHYVTMYVRQFYAEGFKQGRHFEFKVTRVPDNPSEPYVLIDRNGIELKLLDRSARLRRGQIVRCVFTRLDNLSFSLQLSEHSLNLPLITLDETLRAVHLDTGATRVLLKLFKTAPFLERARHELASGRVVWILSLLRSVNANISDIFVSTDLKKHHRRLRMALECISRLTLYILEGSAFLRGLSPRQRQALQEELTAINESLTPCMKALDIIVKGQEKQFINELLEKLRQSGFLYHPTIQFSVLMLIFRHRPEHVGEMFSLIYDAIMEWNLQTWTNEPFRSAFVEQFELYISELRREIDICPQADTVAEKARIENMLKALALQLCIAEPDKLSDYNRNRSLFYRYISLLRPSKADLLIDKAFNALSGNFVKSDISYNDIKEPALMMTRAAVNMPVQPDSPNIKRFVGHAATVELHGHHLTVRAANADQTGTILPAGMINWLSPEIFCQGVKRFTPASIKKIKTHQEFWQNLFSNLACREHHNYSAPTQPTAPSIGDDVLIQIDSVEPDPIGNNPRFLCHIDDVNFIGKGFFMKSSLVGYHFKSIDRQLFTNSDGETIHLIARVTDIQGDNLVFDPRPALYQWIDDNVFAGQELNAVIASHNTLTDDYSAISELGLGMLLHAPDDLPPEVTIGPHTIVRIRVTQTSDRDHIRGQIIGLADNNTRLGKDIALATLLSNLDYREDLDNNPIEQTPDEDEILSRETIREIIDLYILKALGSDTVMQAYDTLKFCWLLAGIIDDNQLAENLELHSDLLQLHVDFADNRSVDSEKLQAFRNRVVAGSLSERLFRRMEIVSWLGSDDHNAELWAQAQSPDSELEGKFARMVLSYNMLVASSLQENEYARKIKDDICALLKVNNEPQNLKYYGCESQFTEFKSSMVFCADSSVNHSPEESLRKQTFEIMHVIAGFMNTTGGKLYIGVNDLHFERGLDDDFKALRLPYSADPLKRMDELLNYLTMRVAENFGLTQSTLVHISVDEESSKGVLIVTVKPSRQPVYLQNTIYVRLSTSTVPILEKDDIRQFVDGRALAYDDMMKMQTAEADPVQTPITPDPIAPAASVADSQSHADSLRKKAESISVAIDAPSATAGEPIATSLWRNNILHDDGTSAEYVVPELYIYFIGDHHLTIARNDNYTDTDPACRLALAVLHNELDGYLLMAFEDERMIKVPISQLVEKAGNRNHRYWADAKLVWATIARDDQAVLTIHTDNSDNLHFRATPVTEIVRGSLTNTPARILAASTNSTPVIELIRSESLSNFSKGISTNLNNRQIGFCMRTRLGLPAAENSIKHLINSCSI